MEEHKENIHTKALNVQKMSNAKEDEKVGDSLTEQKRFVDCQTQTKINHLS